MVETTPHGAQAGAQESIPAATIIVFRNGPDGGPPEILMTERSSGMVFAGGMAVFPGGRVDPADYELGLQQAGEEDAEEAAHQIAAVRETLEETGLVIGIHGAIDADLARAARHRLLSAKALAPVLAEFGWSLDLSQLTPFARWHPKSELLKRVYDTRFYLADLGSGAVEIEADLTENTHLFWTTAQDALDAADRGDIKLIFPTRRNLERVAQFDSFAAARTQAEAIPVQVITPLIGEKEGKARLYIREGLGYPVTGEALETSGYK